MNTQLSIKVKNENCISRVYSWFGLLGLFIPSKVKMYVDGGSYIKLKARKDPYLFDIEPGSHHIDFEAKSKAGYDKFIGGFIFGSMGLAGGGRTGMAMGQEGAGFAAGLMGHCRVQESALDCDLQEGDILKISIKPKRNGSVKVKLL